MTLITNIHMEYSNNILQVNALTHWIDGFNVYGSNLTESLALRNTRGGKGKLRTNLYNGRQLLPFGPGCTLSAPCFTAGQQQFCLI